ncbi:MAG: ribosomal protein S18-alanine N-acetyltransferase [Anaerovoracaceae bacterium]|jgi:ribosomal-protein-alanine N-acetyltransferase
MNELVIRMGIPRDAHELGELEKACFSEPWSEKSILKDIQFNENARYYIAAANGNIIGYIACWIVADEAQVNNVAVLPQHRRNHVASILMRTMIHETEQEGVTSQTLEVRESNEAAIGLYEKMGFTATGRRHAYYQDNGEDAIIMWRIGDPGESDPEMLS